jgi:hypothetical protein
MRVRRIINGACAEAVRAAATTSHKRATILVRITKRVIGKRDSILNYIPGEINQSACGTEVVFDGDQTFGWSMLRSGKVPA